MAPEARRAFLALWPPAELAEALLACALDVPGRKLQASDLHLTLAFLGDLDAERLAQVCAIAGSLSFPSISLQPDRLAYWAHNRILWAGFSSPPAELMAFVAMLHQDLRHAGFELDGRSFVPHMSLARRAPRPAQALPRQLPGLPAWQPESWHLAASIGGERNGLRYRQMASWPGGRAGA